ncbi:entericidin A/B family lipoprotein [Rhodovulum sp. YNF3179]
MRRIVLLAACLALASCGTVEGFGRDISDGARAVRSAF